MAVFLFIFSRRSFVICFCRISVTSALMLWPILWAFERASCAVGHSRGSKSLCMDGSASQKRRAENNRHVAGFCITPESCTRSVQCALAVVWSAGKTSWKSKSRQGVSCFLIWGFCKPFWETILTLNCISILKWKISGKLPRYGFRSYLDVRVGWLCTVCACVREKASMTHHFVNILYKKEIPSKCINFVSLSALSADPE